MKVPHESVTEELRAVLKSHGMRVTTVRMAVLRSLHDQGSPMTHEQIMTSLSDGSYDKASVWRLLSDLADKGVLRRMDLGDRVWRYELLDVCRGVEPSHAHFLCNACGHVACLPPLVIRTQAGHVPLALSEAQFTTRFEGTCGDCQVDAPL